MKRKILISLSVISICIGIILSILLYRFLQQQKEITKITTLLESRRKMINKQLTPYSIKKFKVTKIKGLAPYVIDETTIYIPFNLLQSKYKKFLTAIFTNNITKNLPFFYYDYLTMHEMYHLLQNSYKLHEQSWDSEMYANKFAILFIKQSGKLRQFKKIVKMINRHLQQFLTSEEKEISQRTIKEQEKFVNKNYQKLLSVDPPLLYFQFQINMAMDILRKNENYTFKKILTENLQLLNES